MERHSDAVLISLSFLCSPASSALVESVHSQTEPSEDVEQSVDKPYVCEIT